MEYTFKNSLSEKTMTVVLSEYSLSLQTEGSEVVLPYANIQSVRLKKSGNNFFTMIKPVGKPEICIGNMYIASYSEQENRSPQYISFVRILHVHLKEKSMAYYVCGNSLQHIIVAACASVIAAFGIAYLLESLIAYQSNLLAVALSFSGITAIAIINWGHFPNVYKPDQIPSKFLPFL